MIGFWHCPRCPAEARTVDAATPMHRCPDIAGLLVPLVPQGRNAKVDVVEREDYIAGDLVQLTAGRPVMSVVTTRDDGQDCTVYAPTATAEGAGHDLG